DSRLSSYLTQVESDLTTNLKSSANNGGGSNEGEGQARILAERLALALQASLVVQQSAPAIAEAFITSRLTADHGQAYGTLPAGVDFEAVLAHEAPQNEA